ncbi:hypothetical protein CBR_g38091 [Chara braunii]|uniref:Selenoprotein O n=1 Tax=Chara braunii TaxID=69332 RepID=A0A388K0J0_CHABU|nr:hypothetical protein CBR_g38091 [Chara braunii]|eukprot:GBG63473.1 hypothetical protein CBR_g38091 [Chara braunii]
MTRGVINLLYKKGDRDEMRNWRPISLLNFSYKLLAKSLANRLTPYLPALVGLDQGAFVRGRSIFEKLATAIEAMKVIEEQNLDVVMLMLDLEKAYDRVNWSLVLTTLRAMHFGDRFCSMVKALYFGATAVVQVNGHHLEEMTLTRSLRQGCPLAPLLFVLQMEMLLSDIRRHPLLKGLRLRSGKECRVKTLADDLLAFSVNNKISLEALKKCLARYAELSEAAVNWNKSIFFLSSSYTLKVEYGMRRIPAEEAERYLGVQLALGNCSASQSGILQEKVTERIRKWGKAKHLSLVGRVLAVTVSAFSILWYVARLRKLEKAGQIHHANVSMQFGQVRGACYSRVVPSMIVSDPHVIYFSPQAADLIDLDLAEFERPEFALLFSGAAQLPGSSPYAQCYGGHQFGVWAGQLGDGRAITLGEVVNSAGERWELQLKGAGKTPYSRFADGMAVLRSSIREFVCSEAMFHLGVPTTRALSLVATGEGVFRDMFYDGNVRREPGAVVCRMAPSFVRFGTFQIHAARGGEDNILVQRIADYVIKYHFPQLEKKGASTASSSSSSCKEGAENGASAEIHDASSSDESGKTYNKYAALLVEVAERTAKMVAKWQAVGFTHGVLNTDNMSILGLTIDYGPFGFLEAFDPKYTPNTTDLPGRRYCFQNQPDICLWNIVQFVNALLSAELLTTKEAEEGVARYAETFLQDYGLIMAQKLGIKQYDKQMVSDLLALMAADKVDFTNFFRALGKVKVSAEPGESGDGTDILSPLEPVLGKELNEERQGKWKEWMHRYRSQLIEDGIPDEERRAMMNAVNPCYIPRNYLLQVAIEDAEKGEYDELNQLMDVLRQPYEEQQGREKYAEPAPAWANKRGVCMLSCSS